MFLRRLRGKKLLLTIFLVVLIGLIWLDYRNAAEEGRRCFIEGSAEVEDYSSEAANIRDLEVRKIFVCKNSYENFKKVKRCLDQVEAKYPIGYLTLSKALNLESKLRSLAADHNKACIELQEFQIDF